MTPSGGEISCQICGKQAHLVSVAFYQNIGMLLARQQRSVQGKLCQECTKEIFKKFSLTTLTLGWWGVISLFITPIFLINNVIRYALSQREFAKR